VGLAGPSSGAGSAERKAQFYRYRRTAVLTRENCRSAVSLVGRSHRERVRRQRGVRWATLPVRMEWQHISDEDLERYYLGTVTHESELEALEEHLLVCSLCVGRAEKARKYVDAIRGAIIEGGSDLE
jgi:hypothetical protein